MAPRERTLPWVQTTWEWSNGTWTHHLRYIQTLKVTPAPWWRWEKEQSIARKQNMNVGSSTEGKLVAVDDAATMILWTKLFLEAQGYDVEKNIVYQDNKSTILLETNGKKSSGKQTRAQNMRYFFVTDQVEKGNMQIEHRGANNMVGDFFMKPLQGERFQRFWNDILGR
jgi:hypothetical protein